MGEQQKKPCMKCLLQDYDEEKYLREIRKEIDWMDEKMRAGDEMYEKRLAVCRECDKLNGGTCMSCGCYVELRAAAKAGRCPGRKW